MRDLLSKILALFSVSDQEKITIRYQAGARNLLEIIKQHII